ncbi:MAG: YSC84-related protein [Gammaproteobacteria bacterium]
MIKFFRMYGFLLLVAMAVFTVLTSAPARADSSYEIDRDVKFALTKLYGSSPNARALAQRAKGILVFPSIVKGGFIFGMQYGEGALLMRGRTAGYYNTISASYGFQAGVQTFGYALFLMSNSAFTHLNSSGGWELGVGPSIVVLDAGRARALTTTTARDDIYAFFFDQKGLMAGAGLQGTKISNIDSKYAGQ